MERLPIAVVNIVTALIKRQSRITAGNRIQILVSFPCPSNEVHLNSRPTLLPLTVFQLVFDNSPICEYLLSPTPEAIILAVNQKFLDSVSRKREDLIGASLFAAFPENPTDPEDSGVTALRQSLLRVIATGKPDTLALQRYPIRVVSAQGVEKFEERYWSVVNTPLFDDDGQLLCISHNTMDVTDMLARKAGTAKTMDANDQRARLEAGMFTRAQTIQEVNQALEAERTRLQHLFDHAPGFVYFTKGSEHVIVQANDAFHELSGPRELIGKTIRQAFPEVADQGFFELHDQVYRSGQRYIGHANRVMLQKSADMPPAECFVDVVFQPITDADGNVTGICGQGQDITDKKRIEDELRTSEERWKLAVEASGGGLWDWNLQTNEVSFSSRWKTMLGYADHEIGNSMDAWKKLAHPDDQPSVLGAVEDHLTGKTDTFSSEYRLKCKDGSWLWVLSRGAVIKWDADGQPIRIIGTHTDISHNKRSEQQVWHQANFDALTGLPNRRLFRDRLELEVKHSHRNGKSMALLFIDLDRFKEVNDLLGHDAGDLLLVEAGRRILRCVRQSDTVARLGGDEFTVILSDLADKAHVEEISSKIIQALAAPFVLGQEIAYISGSIGITLYPADAGMPEDLIRNADQAMYCAKKAGRNQFSYFTRSMQEQAHARLRLSRDLRVALPKDQFQVYYQPIVMLASRDIVKAEALLRWHHPKLGLVEPAQFIPLAEETGLINEIGDWVFKEAASCSQQWSARTGEPFEISVNRSPVQFMAQPGEMNWPLYLEQQGLSGSNISVDITEEMLTHASPGITQTLLQYRDAGIHVALDDFGTGYSSMAYLKKFDIDYLKIDQSFVRDIETNANSYSIARSMILMAHELGLKVIAEGVETSGQAETLEAAGCDYGQGYLFSRPVPQNAFEQLLDGGKPVTAPMRPTLQ
jgi:diguanylate cyclase (GGDEF)-like protein/PAS domain S-box-containing protein